MAVTTWNTTTINGVEYLVIDTASFRIPLDFDPSSSMFLAVAAPTGGVGNFPALAKGDPGDTPTIDSTINLTVLENDDANADEATWTPLSDTLYQLNLTLHAGPAGADGAAVIDLTDYGTPVAGKILVVNSTEDDLEYATQKVGDRYVPATINSTPQGNAAYTLAAVSVAAQGFAWRPHVTGQCAITGTGANVAVDLIARLNDQASGSIVGRGVGYSGQYPPVNVLVAGPPAGTGDTYDKVAAGASATIYFRAERRTGTDTFTTSAATTTFCVRVCPVP